MVNISESAHSSMSGRECSRSPIFYEIGSCIDNPRRVKMLLSMRIMSKAKILGIHFYLRGILFFSVSLDSES